jgi:hypothetical protein
MLTKLNILILGCIFLYVTPYIARSSTEFESSSSINGPQSARVVVTRAIVYSDENMNSPLGYISNGKLISVGNPRKKNPDLVPMVVYGRIAFIELKNIHYENATVEAMNSKRGAPKEHNIDITLSKIEERLSENNSVYFSIQQFSAGEETQNLVNSTDGILKDNFLGFGIYLIHRQIGEKLFWGAGYEYNSLTTQNIKLPIYMLNPNIGYTILRNPLFLVDLTFAIDFSISAQFKINDRIERAAFMFGPQIGSRIVFFPTLKYHPFGSISYRNYKVYDAKNLIDENGVIVGGITKLSGINLNIGVALEF